MPTILFTLKRYFYLAALTAGISTSCGVSRRGSEGTYWIERKKTIDGQENIRKVVIKRKDGEQNYTLFYQYNNEPEKIITNQTLKQLSNLKDINPEIKEMLDQLIHQVGLLIYYRIFKSK